MKIKATRLVTTEAELPTPSWWKKGIRYFLITETAAIEIYLGVVCRWDSDGVVYQEKALEASTGEQIAKEQFDAKYAEVVSSFDNVVHGEGVEEREEKSLVVTEAEKWAGIR